MYLLKKVALFYVYLYEGVSRYTEQYTQKHTHTTPERNKENTFTHAQYKIYMGNERAVQTPGMLG